MNDRFKFRVWDKRSNQMHYNDFIVTATGFISAINYCSNDYMTMYFKQNDLETDKNCVLMQCTGLKDKNGKLIYEGDVVRDSKNLIYKVVFDTKEHESSFCLRRIDKDNYYAHIITWRGLGYREKYEVIGNIYEDKELLNENRKENPRNY